MISKAKDLRRTTDMTWVEIAKECGVSREWLSNSGACEGFEQRQKGRLKTKHSKEYKEQVVKQLSNGKSVNEVSDITGIAQSTLRFWKSKTNENQEKFYSQ